MKVKIVAGTNNREVENVINEFIKDKVVHDIKYTSIVASNCSAQHRALIMYDDMAHDDIHKMVPEVHTALL